MEHFPETALAKFTDLQSTMELRGWNERDEEVALLRELKEQDKQIQAMFLKLDDTRFYFDGVIDAKLKDMIRYIYRATKPANMPTDDRKTFVQNVKVLNDNVTTKRKAVENAMADTLTRFSCNRGGRRSLD
ncbi:uncharacterized protein B0T23DRAFT_429435 [Neurospora hispaniola]|uniref:Uncharacterized protein n=1 Tax=Neurospora hispaniola TaxID=588809 RepID=A0AAJ0I5H1_9PEZI|nr:hypothetical protein B0T23DRAFT_429435 [Neurospora hispaniola]